MEQQKEPSQQRPAEASCPECGTPRAADHTPSCACGTRASEALRDARTAQAAAAEDFNPLRIRPYVELDGTEGPQGPPGAPVPPGPAETAPDAPAPAAEAPAAEADATMTLRAVDAGALPGAAVAAAGPEPGTGSEPSLPTPLAPSAGSPNARDLRLFETSATAPLPAVTARTNEAGGGSDGGAGGARKPRRRRKGVLLSAAGTVVVVLGAAGFASGLFSYEAPSRDGAAPDEVRAGVPDPSSTEATPDAEPSAPSAPSSASGSPGPSVSASASAGSPESPSPSAPAPSASSAPSRSAEPSPTASPTPTEQASQESGDDGPDFYAGPELRRGDQGPEVVELQQRLAKAGVYAGDHDGRYDRRVEESVRTFQWWRGIRSDESGVYGRETRQRLESETGGL
ncbi:peptidoglycan-binding domain-containing protein [Streptomyces olivaceus]|uniref:peptidoglycan-binding domain-containing protein n=1 Tax=Streptomyces olivaceus TaxID=47716 RepID=UPI001CC9D058|nr:peptidoglycan-binding domain-containing protein [Streptomyces olivaceus]MBZ6228936.1 peptidoglycan-binding protein [Streptomyces olivaceus]